MLDRHRGFDVSRSILVSLSYFGEEQGPELLAELRARAERDLGAAPDAMQPYALSYCREYVTTPQNLLSYLAWDKPSMTYALNRSPVPVSVIYGGGDKRIDAEWLRSLDGGGISVHMVPGANHFFDLAHDLDDLPQRPLRDWVAVLQDWRQPEDRLLNPGSEQQ
mgnify:CR=1 FL=1